MPGEYAGYVFSSVRLAVLLAALAVARYFCPSDGVGEGPLTQSIDAAHAPRWAQRLVSTWLTALRDLARSGQLQCRVVPQHVYVRGSAVQYLQGTITP
ncbi:putative PhzF superfamily epimerase YddE/YHI9 [Xanthomonas campestris]|uniref:PhzF family phenazine biosynthesis protein n=1 Tax=Xanthomonas euroxanthea TaxID=2259622 RepID=UPI001610AC89|nr:PhzF family phenazine biosynthesis protein [Xanthomonas euroxanthea]MBB3778163.1 putative PhzF superfamily epimerase YddE/YHI9 [Xanthomonas euroxanthea]